MTEIKKILIANRGEIACRIIKAARKLGKKSVVVFHEADAGTRAVRMADEAVRIEAATPVAAYLSIDNILAACKKTGADAVHPGFGFLSENAGFAQRVIDAGLIFIGPSPSAIEAMGDKIRSKRLAQQAGVSIIPGFDGEISGHAQMLEVAKSIGFPIMIKASGGGGGKGMRVVHNEKECASAFDRTVSEAKTAFGDGRVFIEKYIEQPRHIEIQILADTKGSIVHLGERECSIQRRYQKIIEEAPSPFLDDATRQAMGAQAIALAKAVNYSSAGTVEFVVDRNKRFYFLEMNTRIQVEHPVTEMITGIDIVAEQVRIAEGAALGYGQKDIRFSGHAIECRLCAEDADQNFAPATGKLLSFAVPEDTRLRLDSGVETGDTITASFDSMLAKLIAHGDTRAKAISHLQAALQKTAALGVTTNADYLQRILAHPAFAKGDVHTGFLADHAEDLKRPPLTDEQAAVIISAAFLSDSALADQRFTTPLIYGTMGRWRT